MTCQLYHENVGEGRGAHLDGASLAIGHDELRADVG